MELKHVIFNVHHFFILNQVTSSSVSTINSYLLVMLTLQRYVNTEAHYCNECFVKTV